MAAGADANPRPAQAERSKNGQLALRRLLPAGEEATAAEIVEGLGLWERPAGPAGRPRVLLNMVSTVDGRASIGGRSAPLSGRADRELFHGLRLACDAVLVGAATVRMERYGRIIREPSRRRLRREHGLGEEPLACVVSAGLALPADLPLLAEPEARVVIVTASAASLPATAAQVDYVRAERAGRLDLSAALGELRARFGVQILLCEGGPHLSSELLGAGLVDELFLSLAPTLAGGEATEGAGLRILAGPELEPPRALELVGALERDSHLFLRYAVRDSSAAAASADSAPSSPSAPLA
jgi:riboflavin biosynthesis pyrimidine reductase